MGMSKTVLARIIGGMAHQIYLPNLSAAIAARRAAPSTTRQARIMTLGHSWVSGGGAGTSDGRSPGAADIYGLLNCIPNSWSQKLCEHMTAAGIPTVRNGFMGTQRGPVDPYLLNACDPRINFSSDVVPGSSVAYIGARNMPLPGNGASPWIEFTPDYSFDRFKVWGNRSINVYSEDTEIFVDDVSKAHINANVGGSWYAFPGAATSGLTYVYSGSKIKLVNLSATKSFSLCGIECFGGGFDAFDVVLTMSGHSGSTMADHVAGGATDSARINAIPGFGADLIIVELIVNDANGAYAAYSANGGNETILQTTLNTWKTNLKTIYSKNPNSDFILIGDPDAPTGSASPYIIQRYHDAAKEVIAETGRGFYVDVREWWGTYDNSVTLGYRHMPSDTLHPSALGHDVLGQQIAQAIAAGI